MEARTVRLPPALPRRWVYACPELPTYGFLWMGTTSILGYALHQNVLLISMSSLPEPLLLAVQGFDSTVCTDPLAHLCGTGSPTYNSVIANPGPMKSPRGAGTSQQAHREFIVFEGQQVYPEFVVYFK